MKLKPTNGRAFKKMVNTFIQSNGELKDINRKKRSKPKVEPRHLIPSELRVMRLICMQYSSQEIAETLHLTKRTVDAYRASILEKTQAKNSVGILVYAVKNGLYEI